MKCSNDPAVKPVVSRTARIELAYTEAETSEPVIVGKNIGQVQQIAGKCCAVCLIDCTIRLN